MDIKKARTDDRSNLDPKAALPNPIPDPALFTKNMIRVLVQSQKLVGQFLKSQAESRDPAVVDPFNIGGAFTELLGRLLSDPRKLVHAQLDLWQSYVNLWQHTMSRIMGDPSAQPLIAPAPGDKRFKDTAWEENEIFDFIKQSYLLTARWLQSTVADVEGLDNKTHKKIEFHIKQFADAIAPTNFVLTNPEVLRATIEENGDNLVRGLKHVLEDLERGKGKLMIRQTDPNAFRLGENVAVTPGKVVFRNELIELIQYQPTTESVYERPLLIFPAFINKYYILDLNPEKSFVKWAVEQGLTVFIVSWVNPDARLARKSFEDYMREGVIAAIDAVEIATGVSKINTAGYCVGGTLLSASLAYNAQTSDERIASATCFAAQVDYTEAGDLLVFIDDAQLESLRAQMEAAGGFLPAANMFATFNMLRSNDLIWSYVVNNYLLGREPFPFDLLYWNSDQTRLPIAIHLFYLRELYKENKLATGRLQLDGKTINLKDVKAPVYLQSCKEDHIAPARSVFKGLSLFGGPVRFVVAGSGHIAGVINPPKHNKYQYWINDTPAGTYDEWWKGVKEHPGSWWTDWIEWVKPLSGPQVGRRIPGDGALKVIEDAPGSYVRVKGT